MNSVGLAHDCIRSARFGLQRAAYGGEPRWPQNLSHPPRYGRSHPAKAVKIGPRPLLSAGTQAAPVGGWGTNDEGMAAAWNGTRCQMGQAGSSRSPLTGPGLGTVAGRQSARILSPHPK